VVACGGCGKPAHPRGAARGVSADCRSDGALEGRREPGLRPRVRWSACSPPVGPGVALLPCLPVIPQWLLALENALVPPCMPPALSRSPCAGGPRGWFVWQGGHHQPQACRTDRGARSPPVGLQHRWSHG
jgi:hypothetical protein